MNARKSSRQRYQRYKEVRREMLRTQGRNGVQPISPDGGPAYSGRRTRNYQRIRTSWGLFKAFFGFLRGHRGILAASLGGLTVSTLLGLIPLYGPKIVVDSVLGDEPLSKWIAPLLPDVATPRTLLTTLAIITVVIAIVAAAVRIWSRWHATRVAKRLQVEVRRRTFNHAAYLPLHRIQELRSGGVAGILRDDAGAAGQLVFSMIYNPWRAVTQLLGSMAILVFVDWRLLIGAVVLLPLVWLSHRTWIARIRPLWRDVRETRRHVDSHATEAFGGMRVVRAFGRQRSESATFTGNSNMMLRQELHTWWWTRAIETGWSILIPAASAALLWYGGMRILSDRQAVAAGNMAADQALSVGDLVMFLGYLAALLSPIATLAATAAGLQNGLAALDRVLDLLDEPKELETADDAVILDKRTVRGRIDIERMNFTYPRSDETVLRDINLHVEPGQTVALVGSSGAGKTTLCNLVARFYDPSDGAIKFDGHDLRQIDVESYRRLLGVVEQDIFLFDGTVAANIGYAQRDANQAEIEHAARLANAHSFITEMGEGYETLIGERGVKLSGGQRQRLAIARALLADPSILILDEATSNLDTESERLIQSSLINLLENRTCFVIAHRLSTITHADQIVVLDHGQVVETGTHEQLMQSSGAYRHMIDLQFTPPSALAAEAFADDAAEPAPA